MAVDALTSLVELKQLLVTGYNRPSRIHLVRYLVDWYQREERNKNRENPENKNRENPELAAKGLNVSTPCDFLLRSTAVIPRLVTEGKADLIIDTLRSYSNLSYVDKEAVVMCLAVAAKQGDQKKLVTDAHSAVREICTNTHLFFLFIQLSKMIAKKSGHSGWGRGLRRAVHAWYSSREPKRLALEVTRHSSAHGWTHRDVVRLAHLKLKEMPIGTQVVLHYVFTGLEKTVQEYTGKDNTAELLDLVQMLDKDGHPEPGSEDQWDVNQVIVKVNKLYDAYEELSLDDVPPQSLKSAEVWSHMLDKLTGESVVISVNRMAKASLLHQNPDNSNGLMAKLIERLTHSDVMASPVLPATPLLALHAYEHPLRFTGPVNDNAPEKKPNKPNRAPIKKSTKTNQQLVDALQKLIATCAKNIPKTSRKMGICVDVRRNVSTSHVWAHNPEGKGEVTGHEAAAVTILTLNSGGTCPEVYTGAFSNTEVKDLPVEEGTTHIELIEKFKETVIGEVNVEAALKWGQEKELETIVILTHKLEVQDIQTAIQAFNNNTNIRLVLCGLGTKHIDTQRPDNFLLVLGFDQRMPTIIRAYHERLF